MGPAFSVPQGGNAAFYYICYAKYYIHDAMKGGNCYNLTIHFLYRSLNETEKAR